MLNNPNVCKIKICRLSYNTKNYSLSIVVPFSNYSVIYQRQTVMTAYILVKKKNK